jgi:hypothetical protein
MSVKIRQRFRVTDGIGVEYVQCSAGERDCQPDSLVAIRRTVLRRCAGLSCADAPNCLALMVVAVEFDGVDVG